MSKIKKLILVVGMLILLSICVNAIYFNPQGDIEGFGFYAINDFTNISGDVLYGDGSLNNVTGCSNTQVLTYNSSNATWYCSTSGTGTVSSIGIGTGLSGTSDPITSVGNISIDGSYINNTIEVIGNSTYIKQSEEGNLNVNDSNFWSGFDGPRDLDNLLTLDWNNITNKFITAVDNIYLYMSGTTATLNETKLNATIANTLTSQIDNDTIIRANNISWILNNQLNNSHLSNFTDDINATSNQPTNTYDNMTFDNVTATNFNGNVSSSYVINTPSACPSNNAISYYGGATNTCVDDWVNLDGSNIMTGSLITTGLNVTGDALIVGNLTINGYINYTNSSEQRILSYYIMANWTCYDLVNSSGRYENICN